MIKHISAYLAAAVLLAGAYGCSGGGGPTPQTTPTPPSTDSPPPGSGTAAFTLVIPSAGSAQSSSRKPEYISPDTQSLEIQLTSVNGNPPPSGTQTVLKATLTTSSSYCTQSQNPPGLSCTVPFQVPVGSDSFIVTLYSTTNEQSGSELSQASATASIAEGVVNQVSVTMQPVNASVVLSIANPSPAPGTATNGIGVAVSEKDAQGNPITGSSWVAVTLSDSDTSGATTLDVNGSPGSTVSASTDTVTLDYSGLDIGGATITGSAANLNNGVAQFAPPPAPVVLTPNSLSFLGTLAPAGTATPLPAGYATPAPVTASQAGWTGSPYGKAIAVTDSTSSPCNLAGASGSTQFVSITPSSGTSFTVSPLNAGTTTNPANCSAIFTGGVGQSAPLSIGVTSTNFTLH